MPKFQKKIPTFRISQKIFNKLENFKNPQSSFEEESEIVQQNLEEIGYDDPYFDEWEQECANSSELEFKGQ